MPRDSVWQIQAAGTAPGAAFRSVLNPQDCRHSSSSVMLQDVMRHIQALLYRSLRHRLLQARALAPLAKRHSVGPEAASVVDAAVGDIYGEVGFCSVMGTFVRVLVALCLMARVLVG